MAGKAKPTTAQCNALGLDTVEAVLYLVNIFTICKEISVDVVCRFDLPYPPDETVFLSEDENEEQESMGCLELCGPQAASGLLSHLHTQLPKVPD